MKFKICYFLLLLLSIVVEIKAQDPSTFTYKIADTTKLKLIVYKPEHFKPTARYKTIVFFFGGGWISGTTMQFEPFAKHMAEHGLVAILVDYRVKSRQGTTPIESLKDAKSAIRYIREHAGELNVNPDKLIASGGSAGGQLAAACYTNKTINDTDDNLKFSSKPNALVLFNPVIDNSKEGYGYDRVKDCWKDFSPLENIEKGFPPVIFFVGTKDKHIPVSTARSFQQKIESVGGRCDLKLYEDQEHGFFNKENFREEILSKVDIFLKSIGFMN